MVTMMRDKRPTRLLWILGVVSWTAAALAAPVTRADEDRPVEALEDWLASDPPIEQLSQQAFATVKLTKSQAERARELLWKNYLKRIAKERAEEIEKKVVVHGDLQMKYAYFIYGKAPRQGRSLYISMHGGGGAPARVNDSQWENQKRLYRPKEGVYLAPRAPTNTWNLWHQGHIDPMFARIIQNLVATEGVDPNRVYLTGYSAGGDGVYQVAPRMADRFAAAAMMAGHPNESSPLALRNLPFAIHVGALDAAYKRNQVAKQWGERLAKLREADPQGYRHSVTIHANKGHWMDRQDAVAIAWMARHIRQPVPQRIVWQQDDVTHESSYWLAIPKDHIRARGKVIAERDGQVITISEPTMEKLTVRLDDRVCDLDKPITIQRADGTPLFAGEVNRTIATLGKTLWLRGDKDLAFVAEVTVELSSSSNDAN